MSNLIESGLQQVKAGDMIPRVLLTRREALHLGAGLTTGTLLALAAHRSVFAEGAGDADAKATEEFKRIVAEESEVLYPPGANHLFDAIIRAKFSEGIFDLCRQSVFLPYSNGNDTLVFGIQPMTDDYSLSLGLYRNTKNGFYRPIDFVVASITPEEDVAYQFQARCRIGYFQSMILNNAPLEHRHIYTNSKTTQPTRSISVDGS